MARKEGKSIREIQEDGLTLAEAFAGDSKFMAAAHIGKAIREARDIEVKPISPLDLMRNLMAQNQKEDMHDEASEDD